MSFDSYGAQSMTVRLREVLVKRPGSALVRSFDDPALGFRHPVDPGLEHWLVGVRVVSGSPNLRPMASSWP